MGTYAHDGLHCPASNASLRCPAAGEHHDEAQQRAHVHEAAVERARGQAGLHDLHPQLVVEVAEAQHLRACSSVFRLQWDSQSAPMGPPGIAVSRAACADSTMDATGYYE